MAANLAEIRTKVRRLTRSPSQQQLADTDIDDYVNTFILYDLPEHLRLFNYRQVFTFYTEPNIDAYSTVSAPPTSPLFNFKNEIISVHPPVYIAGYNSFFSQSREQFFGIYPQLQFISQIGSGDGVTTVFSGQLPNFPVQQNQVLFDSIDSNFNGITLIDFPLSPNLGALAVPDDFSTFYGTVSYVTGTFSINFPIAPGQGQVINAQVVPYQAAQPRAMLYFNDQFTLRPIPDQPYEVSIECYVRPTSLFDNPAAVPDLEGFWQYIAYGAAKKVFEDRMDLESVQQILPEYKKQELLQLRRTIVQLTNERTATIYTEQTGNSNNFNSWGAGGGSF